METRNPNQSEASTLGGQPRLDVLQPSLQRFEQTSTAVNGNGVECLRA